MMQRVLIIGCPGSGKSTFARALQERTGLPLFYLDMLFHRPDRTTVSQEEFDARLRSVLESPAFIIDGNYARTLPQRLEKADTVFWLDYPLEVCLQGVEDRRGQVRPDMPWIEEAEDPEFTEYIKTFDRDQRPLMEAALRACPPETLIVFKSRAEAAAYLSAL